jgi:hypothetical protein
MGAVKNLTQQQIENIQIDEGVVYVNYGETDERLLAPTRGGGEFNVTVTVRDIEYDGRRGKTKGMEVVEDQAATLKVTSLCCSQEDIALAIPGCSVTKDGTTGKITSITNGDGGVISDASYLKNVTMFAKLINGSYKKISIFNVLHLGAFGLKAVQKAEGEIALELNAHFDPKLGDGQSLYKIEDVTTITAGA